MLPSLNDCKKSILIVFLLLNLFSSSKIAAMDLSDLLKSHNGAKAQSIEPYMDGDQQYIRKTFHSFEYFESELNNVQSLETDVQNYQNLRTEDMPCIAKYHRHDLDSIHYKKADGESLRIFLIKAALVDFFDPDYKRSCLNAVKKAGKSIALFHLTHKTFEDESTFFTSVHGDLHPSNIFFKLCGESIAFIDYETLSFNKKRDVNIDIDKLFNHETRAIRGYKLQIIETWPYRSNFFSGTKELEQCQQDYRLFQNALMDGYNSALEDAQVAFKLMNEEGIIKLVPKN